MQCFLVPGRPTDMGSGHATFIRVCHIFPYVYLRFHVPFIDVCVFVFLLQIRTRAVSCKQMTMVNPLQLLMFSQSKVESENGIVRMDDW